MKLHIPTSTTIHPAMGFVSELIDLSLQISTLPKPKCVHRRHFMSLLRKVNVLEHLFVEIRDSNPPLLPSTVVAIKKLHEVLNKSRTLGNELSKTATTWALINSEEFHKRFYMLNEDIASSLDLLPLSLLEISNEMKEQVLLLKMQARRRKIVDSAEDILKAELNRVLQAGDTHDIQKLKKLFEEMNIKYLHDFETELANLHEEFRTGPKLGNKHTLHTLIKLVQSTSRFLYGLSDQLLTSQPSDTCKDIPPYETDIPDEFKCPISLELMSNPVIIATGQTYEKECIRKWLSSGHSTCPKSGQKLIHLGLIPNHVLRNLIFLWCKRHNVKYDFFLEYKYNDVVADMNSLRGDNPAVEIAKSTAAFLVGKLATGCGDVQRQVAHELRLLAKSGTENRICIAQAGAITFLVPLLYPPDPKMQENAVTALLNLSIYEGNKRLIMAAPGALDAIIHVLECGISMEAKQNAAAAIFSLLALDEHRVQIGNHLKTAPALVKLLKEGSLQARKDATSALFNLLLFPGNRAKVVQTGATQVLLGMINEPGVGDDALAVLALIGESDEGLRVISEEQVIPTLIRLLREGSVKGKENSLSVLLALCKHGGNGMRLGIVESSGEVLDCLRGLVRFGTPRARRKAGSLLKLLHYTRNLQI